jgi:iron complex outermembrane receptor protein
MSRTQLLGGACLAVCATVSLMARPAIAAAAAAVAPSIGAEVSEVVVTGSHIVGTPENTALPVTVLSAETLQKQGAPSIVELIKDLPESSGVLGESNQFTAGAGRGQGAYGESNINLRGLGSERTLVLFNGHRLPLANAYAVDTAVIPLSAIGRVEVLKDGAAATYGSDAIGGVVNFITKTNVDGFEFGGDYRFIDGSLGGDYRVDGTWGHVADRWNVMVSVGFQHRSELPVTNKPFSNQSYDANPEGGWTGGGNPEAFSPLGLNGAGQYTPLGTSRLDLGCTALGGQLTAPKPANASPLLPWTSCRGQFSIWDNLEEETNSVQVYAEVNYKIGGSHKLHIEGSYSFTDLPFFKSSPSYVTTRFVPTTVLPANYVPGVSSFFAPGTSPLASINYFVPATNPGFAAYLAANPGQFPAGTTGANLAVGGFRPYLADGNPSYNYAHGVGGRYWHEQINLSATLKGDVTNDIHYEGALTWGQYRYYGAGRDELTDRLELALRGLGGPNCDYKTGTPGVGGCMWLNPFSNAIPGAPRRATRDPSLATNPGFVPSLANTAELADWLMPVQSANTRSQDVEGDFTLNGKLPFNLWGGPIGWAAGGQWRHNSYDTHYSLWGNAVLAPCSDSALPGGSNICVPATGANVFGPVSNPVSLSQDIFAGFAELNLPVTNTINIDASARYEDYGSHGGSTFNPQVRAKWQAVPFFALRGSIGTTFRAPPQGSLIPDPQTALSNVNGTFIPVSLIGNPNLRPETALTFSFGGILEAGHFRASVDYWEYDFDKVLTNEPQTQVVGSLNCASTDPAVLAFIASHFTFSSPTCDPTKIVAVNLLRINGPSIKTDGIDFNASYRFDDVLSGNLVAGVLGSYTNEYKVSSFPVGPQIIPGFEASGKLNFGTIAYPIPKLKGQIFLNYEIKGINIRWTARYTDSYQDQRAALFGKINDANGNNVIGPKGLIPNPIYTTPGNPTGLNPRGEFIGAQVIQDLSIEAPLKWRTLLTITVTNLFDIDPPFARTEIGYDAFTADPLGRTVKVGLRKSF